jgi:Amt family ammonium transporter
LAAQAADAITILIFCSMMTIVFFTILKKTIGLRSDEDAEISGLDMPELGAMAYPDFLEAQGTVFAPRDLDEPITAKSLRDEIAR